MSLHSGEVSASSDGVSHGSRIEVPLPVLEHVSLPAVEATSMPARALLAVVDIGLPGKQAAKAGFEHHLVKPVSTDVLLAAMNGIRR